MLYRQHRDTAQRFLFRLGVPSDNLDDACQEVFLEVYRYLSRFRGESSFTTWLYRLCATQARRVRGRHKVQRMVHELLMSFQHSESGTSDLAEQDMKRRVRMALDKLSEKERLVFVLFELEGVNGSAVARIVGAPEATVWRRLHDARKAFRREIEGQAIGP